MIQVGDKVKRIRCSYKDMAVGDTGIVSKVTRLTLRLEGSEHAYDRSYFELADNYTNHKQELKI